MSEFYQRLATNIKGSPRTCYSAGEKQRSYADLWAAMTKINNLLPAKNKGVIAVYAGKCFENYAAVYSILLSGNCWVPLEPIHPPKRLIQMIGLCCPCLILVDRPLPQEIKKYADETKISIINIDETNLNTASEKSFDLSNIDLREQAYIMFTSGTSGLPKGVPITHKNYINFVESALRILPLKTGDVFADYHDFGFDLSIIYLLCCPLVEGKFAPALTDADRMIPIRHLQNEEVDVLVSVPSLLSRLKTYSRGEKIYNKLKLIIVAGEPFRIDQLAFAYSALEPEKVFNFYGLTETSVENFVHCCDPNDLNLYDAVGLVPIGRPLPGNRAKIVSGGELWIEGVQITSGYLGGVGADRFTYIDGCRWFKTGDRVSEIDGVFFCHGRLDSQVKVGGYRIELGEIEFHLREHPSIDESVCLVFEHGDRNFIRAAIVGNSLPSESIITDFLQERLPRYMHPVSYRHLEKLPVNKSGKVDRFAVNELLKDQDGA